MSVDEQYLALMELTRRVDELEKRAAERDRDIKTLKDEVSKLRTRTYRLRQSGRY